MAVSFNYGPLPIAAAQEPKAFGQSLKAKAKALEVEQMAEKETKEWLGGSCWDFERRAEGRRDAAGEG